MSGEEFAASFVPWLHAAAAAAVGGSAAPAVPYAGPWPPPESPERGILARAFATTPSLGPEGASAWAAGTSRRIAVAGMRLLHELAPVVERLEGARIPWVALKGLHHALRLYPGLEWRPMTDVDILVPRERAGEVRRLLAGAGYGAPLPSSWMGHALTYFGPGPTLDVHVALGRRGTYRPDLERILATTCLVDAGPVAVRTFGTPDDAWAAHALLLAKDAFAPREMRALRIVELALLEDAAGGAAARERLRELLAGWRARRVAERCGELAAWARGGARPGWLRGVTTGLEASLPRSSSRWRFYADAANLLDGPASRARYLGLELAVALARLVTWRRWPALA